MSRTLPAVALLAIAALAPARPPIEGRWRTEGRVSDRIVSVFTFAGGRFTERVSGVKRPGHPLAFDLSGTYALRGNVLVLRATDARLDVAALSPSDRARVTPAAQAGFKRVMLATPTPSGTVRFSGPDRFVVTPKAGKPNVFVRVR